jgi:hypothetical protein
VLKKSGYELDSLKDEPSRRRSEANCGLIVTVNKFDELTTNLIDAA